jgi:uncharacterized delta-60 repeat protein
MVRARIRLRSLTLKGCAAALVTVAGLVMSAGFALAAAGSLDGSFGGNGKVTTRFFHGSMGATAVAIEADGKIVAVGTARGDRFALVRYRANGSPDTSFGGDGRVTTTFSAGNASADAVAIQDDGRIVVAGSAGGRFGGGMFALARYDVDGSLDTSFGGDGRVTTNFTSGLDYAMAVVARANGKIVVGGEAGGKGGLARYDSDGTLDTSFSGDGKVTTPNSTRAVDIQANGKIVAGGPGEGGFGLARYHPNGTRDTSFGDNGSVTTKFEGGGALFGIAIQANGRIVAVGVAHLPARFALGRYDASGTLDTSFGGDGKVITGFSDAGEDYAHAVAIQSNGKILAAGGADFPFDEVGGSGDTKFALTRYNPSGSLDATFGAGGKTETSFTKGQEWANAVAIQDDGKIVAAGCSAWAEFALARYNAA